MASVLVLIIVLGIAALMYFKVSAVKAAAAFIACICASVIALAYFEPLASLLIAKETIPKLAQPLCLFVLFILSFAILQTLASTLIGKEAIELDVVPERAVRVVAGLLTGLVLSGLLLTALAMAPLSAKYPYQRFESARINVENPSGPLLSPDGLISNSFGQISKGALSGRNSFAVLHADFIDQLHLNRQAKGIDSVTRPNAVEVPRKGAWQAPDDLRDSEGQPVPPRAEHRIMIVRAGFSAGSIDTSGTFIMGQLRATCNETGRENRLGGKAIVAYPIGYLAAGGRLQRKSLSDQIRITKEDVSGGTRWLDFAFYVPDGYEPVAVQLKINATSDVPPAVSADDAPEPSPFISAAACAAESAEVSPVPGAKIQPLQLASGNKFLEGISLNITDQAQWQSLQTADSKLAAVFDGGELTCVRAGLRMREAAEPNLPTDASTPADESGQPAGGQQRENRITRIFKPVADYRLLSLKCTPPAAGSQMTGAQLPVLLDLAGRTHAPAGVIAAGKIDGQTVYQVEYCSAVVDPNSQGNGLVLTESGVVARPFPQDLWLTSQAQSISEFFVIYTVKSRTNTIIYGVKPADAAVAAGFQKSEGFIIR